MVMLGVIIKDMRVKRGEGHCLLRDVNQTYNIRRNVTMHLNTNTTEVNTNVCGLSVSELVRVRHSNDWET